MNYKERVINTLTYPAFGSLLRRYKSLYVFNYKGQFKYMIRRPPGGLITLYFKPTAYIPNSYNYFYDTVWELYDVIEKRYPHGSIKYSKWDSCWSVSFSEKQHAVTQN